MSYFINTTSQRTVILGTKSFLSALLYRMGVKKAMFFRCSGYTSRFLCIAIDFAETASERSSKPPEIALLCNKQKAPYCTVHCMGC